MLDDLIVLHLGGGSTVESLPTPLRGVQWQTCLRQILFLREGDIHLPSATIRHEVYRGEERLYWYDDFPHPNDPVLASTMPHHKHVPPDIKHNRIPAPNVSFERPNLPALIQEIEEIGKEKK